MKGSLVEVYSKYATPNVLIPTFAVAAGVYHLYSTYIANKSNCKAIAKIIIRHFTSTLWYTAKTVKHHWFDFSCGVIGLVSLYYNLDSASMFTRLAKALSISTMPVSLFVDCDDKSSIIPPIIQAVAVTGYATALSSAVIRVVMPAEYKYLVYPASLLATYSIATYQFYKADFWNEVEDNKKLNQKKLSDLAKMSCIIFGVGFLSHYSISTVIRKVFEPDSTVIKIGLHEIIAAAFTLVLCGATREACGIKLTN